LKGFKILVCISISLFFMLLVLAFAFYDGCYAPHQYYEQHISDLEKDIEKLEKQKEEMKNQADEVAEIKASKNITIKKYEEVAKWNEDIKSYLQ